MQSNRGDLMHSGPFEWKGGLLASATRVEYSAEAITFSRGNKKETILYTDIQHVYFFHEKRMLPLTQMVLVDIYSIDGRHINLAVSSLGFGGAGFEDAKRAIASFFFHYQAAVRDAEILIGARQSRFGFFLFMGMLILTAALTFYQMRDEFAEYWAINLAVIAAMFAIAVPYWLIATRSKAKPIDEVISRLG